MDEHELENERALLALDALDADERRAAGVRGASASADLQQAAAALAEVVATAPPADVRAAAIERALAARSAGRSIAAAVPCATADAYRRAADDLHDLLGSLSSSEWEVVAHHRYGAVRALVAHLVGIERICLSWVGARPAIDPATLVDHADATQPVIDEFASVAPAVVLDEWYATALEVEAAARAASPTLPVVAHDLPTDVDGLMLLRAFELLAHTHDVAVATGRSLPPLDPERLALMSSRLMGALPFALASSGATAPGRSARIVLTGPSGGCYDVSLSPTPAAGDPDVTIVADGTDMCLLAARRLSPDRIAVTVEGDGSLADLVLASTGAFARD